MGKKKDNNYFVGMSNIAGKGLIAGRDLKPGENIGVSHIDGQPVGDIGKYYNHSENPNAISIRIGNQRHITPLRKLRLGEEITVDYRQQPELEQPEDFQEGYQFPGNMVTEFPMAKHGGPTKEQIANDPELEGWDKYNTELTPEEEIAYEKWALEANINPWDRGAYDSKGYWKDYIASGKGDIVDSDGHRPDIYKKPNHPTFSNESKYHGVDGNYGGVWTKDAGFQPSKQTLERYGEDYYTRPETGQFTREPNRPEHLDLSRFISGENKPTPLVYQTGGAYEEKELTDAEIADLRAQGFVVEEIPQAQLGGPATKQDSIEVARNAIDLIRYYNDHDYNVLNIKSSSPMPSGPDWYKPTLKTVNDIKNIGHTNTRVAFDKKGKYNVDKFPFDAYYKDVDQNKFMKRESATGRINLEAPMILYDKRIEPHSIKHWRNSGMQDDVNALMYDPIAVTPWEILNPLQQTKRLTLYGVKGTPYDPNNKKPIKKITNKVLNSAVAKGPIKKADIIQPPSESSIARAKERDEIKAQMVELKEKGFYNPEGRLTGRNADTQEWKDALAKYEASLNPSTTKKEVVQKTPVKETVERVLPEGYERVYNPSRSHKSEQYDYYYRDPATGSRKRVATGDANWEPGGKPLVSRQLGGAYEELELTDAEIEEYRNGGFVVEEIPAGYHQMPDGTIMADKDHQYQEGGGNTVKVRMPSGEVVEMDPNSPEYAQVQANLLNTTNQSGNPDLPAYLSKDLGEFTVAAKPTQADQYPYWDYLTPAEKEELLHPQERTDLGTHGRYLKDKATYGYGLKAKPDWNVGDALVVPSIMSEGAGMVGRTLAVPQAAMIEGYEMYKGNPYDFSNVNPFTDSNKSKQRAPSDLMGAYGDTGWGTAADIILDPANFVSAGMITKGLKGTKLFNKAVGSLDNFAVKAADDIKDLPGIVNKSVKPNKPLVKAESNPRVKTYKEMFTSSNPEWVKKDVPGLHLKSTMSSNPKGLHKQLDKQGNVNAANALKYIQNNEGSAKYNEFVKGFKSRFGEDLSNMPDKIDYNLFREIGQEGLIPLHVRETPGLKSEHGLDVLGYSEHKPDVPTDKVYNVPTENKSLTISNKEQFGRGTTEHDTPEETLGHMHYFKDAEEGTGIVNVTQIQSDAFQGPYKILPKKLDKGKAYDILENQKRLAKDAVKQWKNAKQQSDGSWLYEGVDTPVSNYLHKQGPPDQTEHLKALATDIESFDQKKLLEKGHEERYIQELVKHFGERGENTLRFPTRHTASKIQGYLPKFEVEPMLKEFAELEKTNPAKLAEEMADADPYVLKLFKKAQKGEDIDWIFREDQETVLKKYQEMPKKLKKLYGTEPIKVTDRLNNTWYEFPIPKEFKEGLGEIKAFQQGGAFEEMELTDAEIADLEAKGYRIEYY